MTSAQQSVSVRAVGGYELWFVAQLTFGLVYIGGAMFLLPPFVLSLKGSNPGDVGIVMAVLPLIGLGAPIIGGLLDRFGSFRIFQHLGLGLFAVAFLVLAMADELIATTLGALLLGVGAALVLTTGMSMMAGSGLAESDLSQRMSLLQMSLPMGQVIGLGLVAVLLAAGVDYSAVFLTLAGLAVLGLATTAATNRTAAERAIHHQATTAPTVDEPGAGEPSRLGGVLLSTFGLVLLVVFLSMAAHSTLESQYANFMKDVFKVDGDLAAAALALAVLVSLPVYPLVGRWVRNSPPKVPLLFGTAARAAVGLALWLLAEASGLPSFVPLAIYGVIMVALPLADVSGALLSASTSPIGPGGGQGGYGFALAAAAVSGAFVGGWAAEQFGYRSLGLIVAVVAAVALVTGMALPSRKSANADEPTITDAGG